ncbi:MAG: DNA recombination protein RecN, partial [Synergistaceae bacterium]|nr:DNA recombination protein RecN [Synergistaceae bacterium]
SQNLLKREKLINNINKLFGGMSEQGLLSELRNIFEELSIIKDEDVNNALSVIEDAAENLRANIASNFKSDEEYLAEQEELEERLGVLRKLKRLSQSHNESELISYCNEAAKNLEWLEHSFNELEDLSKQALSLKKEANALALNLRSERKTAAHELEIAVNNILKDLAMGDSEFKVNFKELNKLRRTGADEIEFILSSGARTGRIDKIASGGELSRLLLALQLSLPDNFLPQTLVFDEIEAGLGGKAAVLSGLKLKELSESCQVILVTHEASIAALGDAHINITRDNATGLTVIKNISGHERVREIARMLSGSPDLSEAQEHARKLLKVL